jgi:fumarylacetoacetase
VQLNDTHDPERASWLESANHVSSDFPIQNLPFGVFKRLHGLGHGHGRGGVAIGDHVIDLGAVLELGLLTGSVADVALAASGPSLEPLLRLGRPAARALRAALSDLLRVGGARANEARALAERWLVPLADVAVQLPLEPRSFTDFCASRHHFERMGAGRTLHPAFNVLPVAYNGRASSVRASGFPVRRPLGLFGEAGSAGRIAAEPMLDFELELGAWLSGDSPLGQPLPLTAAEEHVFGYCLVNDWSARAIQFFEMALGPFLGKSFMTTVSPWIVTVDALAPFRIPGPVRAASQPAVPTHLRCETDQREGGLSLSLEARLYSQLARVRGAAPVTIVRTDTRHLYWTFAQMIAHQASNGCDLRSGDLVATGTVSGPQDEARACLAELTAVGTQPLSLADGEQRTFLEDGDELSLHARAQRPGQTTIGFGECRGIVVPALPVGE